MPEATHTLASSRLRLSAHAWHDTQLVASYARLARLIDDRDDRLSEAGWFNEVLAALSREGVARHAQPLRDLATTEEFATAALLAWNSIEDSPLPSKEWVGLSDTLEDLLPGLVGVSPSSVSRYRSGARPTPDPVAARLHTVALIVTDLAGSYNDFGVRRWFQRPRVALGGKAPAEILSGDWDPDSEAVRNVRELAGWLTGQITNGPVPAL